MKYILAICLSIMSGMSFAASTEEFNIVAETLYPGTVADCSAHDMNSWALCFLAKDGKQLTPVTCEEEYENGEFNGDVSCR